LTIDRLLSSCGDDILLREAATSSVELSVELSAERGSESELSDAPLAERPAWRIDAV
jgi:hypothetical protein